ncbi:putative RNA-binding protein EIF1AD [Mastacembelus armatus]|uniref:Probable RNA-binding protein EIF1AD n=1 Tax=Mastacembelus armatus TaxID=205130 RepID=A0A3Q3M6K1_9TELE|nr:probable RNA-binding protein EIF1AD [Mastacembelus armatus]
MSQATKRKHVVKEVLGDFVTPTENQMIVKIIGSRGNNLHETVTAQGEIFLVSMPTKFRKNIWIKRGDYVIVDPIEEGEKVKAEISVILYKDHIQYLQKQQLWPQGFMETSKQGKEQETQEKGEKEDVSESEDDESDLFVNTNRSNYQFSESEDEEDSEEDSEEEDEQKEGRTENGS